MPICECNANSVDFNDMNSYNNQIQKAIKRLELAKKRNEKIAILGDYDADGIAGTLIIYEALLGLGFKNFLISLSGRRRIYDQNKKEMEKFAKEGVSLIIFVDFGVSAIKEIKFVRKKGIDVIVLDHHTPSKVLPPGIIVNFPNGRKAAAGVVFELVKTFYRRQKKLEKETENFLDLAAIAIVADKINLTESNKKIISEGVKKINQGHRAALRVLARKINLKKLTPNNFEKLVDRINFPKGINEENNLFKLMSVKINKKEIVGVVNDVEKHYQKTQKIIEQIFKENIGKLSAELPAPKIIFVENKINWPQPGINGLVANELGKKFNRPVFVYNRLADKIKASGRASKGFNLVKALRSCPAEWFCNFGGHPQAVGFNIPLENLTKIKERLKNYYKSGKHK